MCVDELRSAADFTCPFQGDFYVCVLWDCDSGFDSIQRRQLATALLSSGCRYAVCAGTECEVWHDDVDLVYVTQHLDDPPDKPEPFVMTTWHTGESEEDVIYFAFNCTNFDEHAFSHFLVLIVGRDPARKDRLERLVRTAG